ncbi:MAG: TraR/DksA family transcriptional regulator [Kiloniellales bacterium]|nr:TraR/DksA family transcriptional regulator [Kiloniellales bacterium]
MSERKASTVEDAVARLLARRQEIHDLTATSAEDRRPVELDQTRVGRLSRMDALQSQAMALETERRRALELRRIAAALQRLEEGEYGYCVTCGEEIPIERLSVDPATPQCVDCARQGPKPQL